MGLSDGAFFMIEPPHCQMEIAPLQTPSRSRYVAALNQPQDHTKSKFQVQSFFDNLEKQSFETVTKISMF